MRKHEAIDIMKLYTLGSANGWNEGYDLFLRAKDRLKIAYYEKPCFFYTKRQGSLSTMSPKFRDKIKKEIEVRVKSNEKT